MSLEITETYFSLESWNEFRSVTGAILSYKVILWRVHQTLHFYTSAVADGCVISKLLRENGAVFIVVRMKVSLVVIFMYLRGEVYINLVQWWNVDGGISRLEHWKYQIHEWLFICVAFSTVFILTCRKRIIRNICMFFECEI